jgi:16S rRNA U516 pseudouridylate synthase RsuA-like enzyme
LTRPSPDTPTAQSEPRKEVISITLKEYKDRHHPIRRKLRAMQSELLNLSRAEMVGGSTMNPQQYAIATGRAGYYRECARQMDYAINQLDELENSVVFYESVGVDTTSHAT